MASDRLKASAFIHDMIKAEADLRDEHGIHHSDVCFDIKVVVNDVVGYHSDNE